MNEEPTIETPVEEVKFRLRTLASDQDIVTLREESDTVTIDEIKDKETQELIQALKDYIVANDGLGIAAVQLGVAKRIFVMRKPFNSDRFLVVINPRILRRRGSSKKAEGCFSITDIPDTVKGAIVKRSSEIDVEFTDEDGIIHTDELMIGMCARIFQHELDHLYGELILDDKTTTGEFLGWERNV